jgi:hypothetical protein
VLKFVALGALAIVAASAPGPTPSSSLPSPSPVADVTSAIDSAYAAHSALRAYSFDIHVVVVQRNFPWLHFTLDGAGHYERGGIYEVHFYKVPGWAREFDHFDLQSIDPRKWTNEYTMSVAQRTGDDVVLTMHSLRKSPLKEARAELSPPSGLREATWQYKYGGHVHLVISPSVVDGFSLPRTDDAEIIMPVAHVTAHADFTNYHVVADSPAPGP